MDNSPLCLLSPTPGAAFRESPFDLPSMIQLTPAPPTLASSVTWAEWDNVRLYRLDLAHGARLCLSPAPRTRLCGLILRRSAGVTLSGSPWNSQEIVVVQNGELDLCTSGPGAFVWIEMRGSASSAFLGPDPRLDSDLAFLASGPSIESLRESCNRAFWLRAPHQSIESTNALRDNILGVLRRATQLADVRLSDAACRDRFELVRRAEAFMWAHVDEPLELNQIADAINCSPRTLVYSFNRCCGCGPMGFFRLQRLNAVRQALSARTPRRRVIDVAIDYGFWHQGHFGAAYRQLFGETPAQTHGSRAVAKQSWREMPATEIAGELALRRWSAATSMRRETSSPAFSWSDGS
jgi:AraC-like DNA-binding protein